MVDNADNYKHGEKSVGRSHATGDSKVPYAVQKLVPESVERILPNSIHDTSESKKANK